MTQLSRPFQIVLVTFALFVAVWFLALRAHNSSTAGGSGSSAAGSSTPASRPTTSADAKARTSAAHARSSGSSAAAATSVKSKSSATHTSSSTVTVKHSASTVAAHTTVVHTTVVKHTSAAKPTTSIAKPAPSVAKHATGAPSMQAAVEHQLQQGKTVLILFWNPNGADDVAVHREIPSVQHALGAKIAIHYASAGQVGAYGTITHAVQVTQTPTLLIVNPHGQTTVLTGLADAFSIEQTIAEARA